MKIAGLITCYNRVSKTEACIKRIMSILKDDNEVDFHLFVTNDGSTDTTLDMLERYKHLLKMTVIQGDGKLFWSGGMRASWNKALETDSFDGFLWINDDTYLNDNIFSEIRASQKFSNDVFKSACISVGATCSSTSKGLTYSGMKKGKRLIPSEKFQTCEMSNGNIVYIPYDIVKVIGVIDKFYKHGIGDIDYTYTAYKRGFPVLLMRGYLGICENDHISKYDILCNKPIWDRYKFVMSPLGFQMREYIYFNKKFWPWKLPFIIIGIAVKIICPKLEVKLKGIE